MLAAAGHEESDKPDEKRRGDKSPKARGQRFRVVPNNSGIMH